jgi:hypothetical protein
VTVPKLVFDEGTHTYSVDGRIIPSVTTIIRPLHDFADIPAAVLERKRVLGTAVHLACELDDRDELDDAATDAEVMGYVAGWRKFRSDSGAKVLMNEQKLYHPTLMFAGQLDRLLMLRNGVTALIDLKTSVTMSNAFGVQLAGYALLLEDQDIPRNALHGLQLRANGAYKLHSYPDPNDAACFRALLSVYHWVEQKTRKGNAS